MTAEQTRLRVDDEWDGILDYLLEQGEVTREVLEDTLQNEARGFRALEELEQMGFVEQTDDGWCVSADQLVLQ